VFTDATVAPYDRQGSSCQIEVASRAQALYDQLWTVARKAKKDALVGRDLSGAKILPIATGAQLQSRIAARIAADPRALLARKTGYVLAKGALKCENPTRPTTFSRSVLFPGACQSAAQTSFAALADCAVQSARCRFCRQLNTTDGLSLDCDAFDGGAVASCAP
jgi:hypothetical protein